MSLVAFVTVLTALLVSSATNDEKAWGSLRPLEDEPTRPHLSEAISDLASMYGLTQRQVEVLDGLSRGKTKSEIADDLCISVETVRVHARRIYAALGIHSIAELNRIVNAQEKTRADQFEK